MRFLQEMTDEEAEEAMAAVAAGDVAALERLYRWLRVPVYATALAVLADRAAAEDVLQDTFVRVFERACSYAPQGRPRAWVLAVARNLALDVLRRRGRDAADTPDRPVAPLDPVGRLVATAALLALGPVERQIVALHDLAGLTHVEIAAELGLPPGTVRWKYRTALARIRPVLAGG